MLLLLLVVVGSRWRTCPPVLWRSFARAAYRGDNTRWLDLFNDVRVPCIQHRAIWLVAYLTHSLTLFPWI